MPTTFWVLSQLRNLMHLKVDANLTCTNMTHELWYWDYCSLLSLAPAPLLSNLYILLAKSQLRNKRSSAFDIISLHPPNNLQLSKAGGMVFTLFKLTTKWEISKLFFKICTTKLLCVQILEGEGWGLDNNLYLSEIKMSKIRWGRWGGGVSIIQTMSSNYLLSFSDITPKLLHHFSPIKIPSIWA